MGQLFSFGGIILPNPFLVVTRLNFISGHHVVFSHNLGKKEVNGQTSILVSSASRNSVVCVCVCVCVCVSPENGFMLVCLKGIMVYSMLLLLLSRFSRVRLCATP